MKKDKEHRRYIRLDTVFPIECQIVDKDKKVSDTILQGFTRNVGKGGMCIEIKAEKGKHPFDIVSGKTKLKLNINIPSPALATESYATVRWHEKLPEYVFDTHIIGVEYDEIESDNQKMIERHVQWLHRRPKVLFIFFLLLLVFAVLLTYFGIRIR